MMSMRIPGARPRYAWLTTSIESAGLVIRSLWHTGLGWLVPVVIALFMLALLLAAVSATGPLAPFVYPLF